MFFFSFIWFYEKSNGRKKSTYTKWYKHFQKREMWANKDNFVLKVVNTYNSTVKSFNLWGWSLNKTIIKSTALLKKNGPI